jgi:hypothetical protein
MVFGYFFPRANWEFYNVSNFLYSADPKMLKNMTMYIDENKNRVESSFVIKTKTVTSKKTKGDTCSKKRK